MDDKAVAVLTFLFIACFALAIGPTRTALSRWLPSQGRTLSRFATGLLVVTGALLVGLGTVAMPYVIPSGSMIPTLAVGDVIIVNRLAYGVRTPWGQRLSPGHGPQRGDVVVFRFPGFECADGAHLIRSGDQSCIDPGKPVASENWVKRVIGLPGDRVSMRGDVLAINGIVVSRSHVGKYRGDLGQPDDRTLMAHDAQVWDEHLPGKLHQVAIMAGYNMADPVPGKIVPAVLPPDCYLVLGDDRHNSIDSRWWGCVTRDAIVGRADRVLLSWASRDGAPSRTWMAIR
jgi:signal peptidase I, bacterial type